MQNNGNHDWGGQVLKEIKGIDGVESIADALMKKLDANKVIDQELKVNLQEKKVLQDKKKVNNELKVGSPREESGIEGMDSAESTAPTDQPGTELTQYLSKTWFRDNFGMEGTEILDVFIKGGREDLIPVLKPLIRAERISLLKSYPSVSEHLIDELPFTDFDYSMLQRNPKTLEIPFRRLVKSWNDANDDPDREQAYQSWSNRISKESHLTRREHLILKQCAEHLNDRGAMNAQSLQSYGLDASSTEVSMLIKSHGFLYGISAVGSSRKANMRGTFYDVERGDLLVKNAGALIGGLFDHGGAIELNPQGLPRLILPFNSAICKHYATALNQELGVAGIIAEGDGLVIEGEQSVSKSLDIAIPFIHNKTDEAIILRKAIDQDKEALRCLNYDQSSTRSKVALLKAWNMSDEDFITMKESVVNG
jgi:hypothetical protein